MMAEWFAFFGAAEPFRFVDLDSYRASLAAVASGTTNTYDVLPYPPFAFLPLWFLHVLPPILGNQVWTALTFALIVVVSLILALRIGEANGTSGRDGHRTTVALTAVISLLLLVSHPVFSQIINGQMSLVVIALAFVDLCGIVPRRFQGVLLGLAGALKLTPLVFVAYYLVTGQRRQAAVTGGSFVTFSAVGWLVFPAGSAQFWTRVGGTGQFGDPARTDNLSIRSMLVRIAPQLGAQTWLWLLLGLIVVAAALWRARVHYRRGETMESLLVVGGAATVVAPIAWPHYFVWLPLIAIWLWFTGQGRARVIGAAIFVVYSVIGVPGTVGWLITIDPRLASVTDLQVLIPMAIAVCGLPRRPARD